MLSKSRASRHLMQTFSMSRRYLRSLAASVAILKLWKSNLPITEKIVFLFSDLSTWGDWVVQEKNPNKENIARCANTNPNSTLTQKQYDIGPHSGQREKHLEEDQATMQHFHMASAGLANTCHAGGAFVSLLHEWVAILSIWATCHGAHTRLAATIASYLFLWNIPM